MKNLLFFINTMGAGGAERVLVDLLNSLNPDKYNIDLLTVIGGVNEKKVLTPVKYCKLASKSNTLSKLLYKLPDKIFGNLFIKNKYDLEIAYLEGFPTKVIGSRKSKAKKIAVVHCDVSVKPILQNYYKDSDKCLKEYKKFDRVIFVSESAKNAFENTFGCLENATVIHNVIDPKSILEKSNCEVNFDFATKGIKMVAVGRLSEEKAFDRLISIASKLEHKYDFELCIIGEGKLRSDLEELIDRLNVKSVNLLGYKDNPYPYIKKADLVVSSSLFEGYSTVVNEALILNKHVVTTKCAGMEEIIGNCDLGLIVENDEDALMGMIEAILKNPHILKQSVYDFDDSAIHNYEKLFDSLL